MRIAVNRSERILAGVGIMLAVAALLIAMLNAADALTGWLGAAVMLQCVPMTALLLVLTMRLVPGAWEPALRPVCEAAMLLLPIAALAFVPVLIGMSALYPWVSEPPQQGFKALWLNPPFFVARTVLWFVLLGVLAWRSYARRPSKPVAALGLVGITLLGSFVAIDWLMTLDPDFDSSGFGLQIIAVGVAGSYGLLVAMRLLSKPPPERLRVLGGLFLMLLLTWAYFQFITYFILWSGNLADNADWFFPRSTEAWDYALIAMGALGGGAMLALLLPTPRGSRRWLIALGLIVAAGKAIEFAWFAVPPHGALALLVFAMAAAGLTMIAAAILSFGCRRRVAA